ncbi:MAG: DUF4282 domain-containing protein [Robiginitomaculum sp.]|nr:DUF4282 domain-containing protein [Robiginitomaculum sp.]
MARQNKQPGFFVALFSFKRMVSPLLLGIIYFLGFVAIVIATAYKISQGVEPHIFLMMLPIDLAPAAITFIAYASVILSGLFLIILWRFLIELMVVTFAIYDELGLVLEMLNQPATPEPDTAIPMPAPIVPPPPQEVAEPEIQPLPEAASQTTEVKNQEPKEPEAESTVEDKTENTGGENKDDDPPPATPTSGADINAPSRRRRR